MREIKFRAWDKNKKEWSRNIMGSCEYPSHITTLDIPENKNLDILQFTGLKDKNGVEIYEGDCLSNGNHHIVVKWERVLCDECNGGIGFNFDPDYYTEIIGNVHEHPELLKPLT